MKKTNPNQILFVLSIVSCAIGALVLGGSRSAIHEIEAFILFTITAVLLSGGFVVRSLDRITDGLVQKNEQKKRRQEVKTARNR